MPLTNGGGGSQDGAPIRATKCATVTMMLADRMARSDWSVDDEHFFETNTMNVWQTLEYLSSINLRKKYHYEGYNDTENIVRTLTPSWRRDSFVEKNPQGEETSSSKYPAERTGSGSGSGDVQAGSVGLRQTAGAAAASEVPRSDFVAGQRKQSGQRRAGVRSGSSAKVRVKSAKRKKSKKNPPELIELDPEYAFSPADYTDLVKCNFNFPRISAILERLMGTNVVRLTDRNYMKDLRDRIDAEYRVQLQTRIRARELKEVERERLLIIEGKTDLIPDELAEDPIFMVNKSANIEIQKTRAKLKTSRERNAEHLKVQGVKWERERLQHEEEERERLELHKERRKEQKEIEEHFKEEDAERGMDLLRIDNEDWRDCEQKLKEFLERERLKMKERSMRVATPCTSDPQDIQNIVRARQKFRETEQRIRQELEEKFKDDKTYTTSKDFKVKSAASKVSKLLAESDSVSTSKQIYSKDYFEEYEEGKRKTLSDAGSDLSTEDEFVEPGSSVSESKRQHAADLQEEIELEEKKGLLISKATYNHLRYEEEKILQLRQARNICELYQLAEEIIIGERVDEEVLEEEMAEEEEQLVQEEEQEEAAEGL